MSEKPTWNRGDTVKSVIDLAHNGAMVVRRMGAMALIKVDAFLDRIDTDNTDLINDPKDED